MAPGRYCFYIALLVLLPAISFAQIADCTQFPAPCPHSEEINQAMDFAGREAGNAVTPQEMAMENNVRNALNDILHNYTRLKHWQLYELMESNYDRPNTTINFAQWCATPYEKRPPHIYEISFIIIVNKDSLQAWQDWYKNEMPQQASQVVADMQAEGQNEANDSELKALNDSVQYYAILSGKYTQDHSAQYASDIQSNNQKGIKSYNDKIALYNKRSDAFVKQLQDHINNKRSSSAGSYNGFAAGKINKTEEFINASVILIHFSLNTAHTSFGLTDGNQKAIIPQKTLNIPGAWYAGLLHNPSPPDGQSYYLGEHDYLYDHPSNIASVLFGKWQVKRSDYNYTVAAYKANRAADDLVSLKSIKCDAILNMVMQIEGRPDYIKQVLNGIDMASLQKLVSQ